MPAQWKIEIIDGAAPGAPAQFRPDLPGAETGAPLQANTGDEVFWVNMSRDMHRIKIAKASFDTGEIPAFDPSSGAPSSSSSYTFKPSDHGDGQAVEYVCSESKHPGERGKIVVPTRNVLVAALDRVRSWFQSA